MTCVSLKEREIWTQTQEKRPCDNHDRDWNDAAAIRVPRIASNIRKRKGMLTPRTFRETMALLIS